MDVLKLPIDNSLKIELRNYLKEFQSYRISNGDIGVNVEIKENEVIQLSPEKQLQREQSLKKLFSKFFFSEFEYAS